MKNRRNVLPVVIAGVCATVVSSFGQVVVPDFRVNDANGNKGCFQPAIAVGPNNEFAITWSDNRDSDGSLIGSVIYGQRYNNAAAVLGNNFRLDGIRTSGLTIEYYLEASDPIFLPSGAMVISWWVHSVEGFSGHGIQSNRTYFSAVDASGNLVANQQEVTASHTYRPQIAAIPGIGFGVVADGSDNSDALLRVFSDSGAPLGEAFSVNEGDNGAEQLVAGIASNGPHTVVVWMDKRSDANWDIYGQRFSTTDRLGGNFKINDDTAGNLNLYPRAAIDNAGNFVVVWLDTRKFSGGDVYGQLYDVNGNKIGSNFQLTADGTYLFEWPASVSMSTSGDFVVAWTDSSSGQNDVWARNFDKNGVPQSLPFVVSAATANDQRYIDVAFGPNGLLYYTWTDEPSANAYFNIMAKVTSFAFTRAENRPAQPPARFDLLPLYPNPLHRTASEPLAIRFRLEQPTHLRLAIYNLLGQQMAELADRAFAAGSHTLQWQGTTGDGRKVMPGMCFVRILAGTFTQTAKLIVID